MSTCVETIFNLVVCVKVADFRSAIRSYLLTIWKVDHSVGEWNSFSSTIRIHPPEFSFHSLASETDREPCRDFQCINTQKNRRIMWKCIYVEPNWFFLHRRWALCFSWLPAALGQCTQSDDTGSKNTNEHEFQKLENNNELISCCERSEWQRIYSLHFSLLIFEWCADRREIEMESQCPEARKHVNNARSNRIEFQFREWLWGAHLDLSSGGMRSKAVLIVINWRLIEMVREAPVKYILWTRCSFDFKFGFEKLNWIWQFAVDLYSSKKFQFSLGIRKLCTNGSTFRQQYMPTHSRCSRPLSWRDEISPRFRMQFLMPKTSKPLTGGQLPNETCDS